MKADAGRLAGGRSEPSPAWDITAPSSSERGDTAGMPVGAKHADLAGTQGCRPRSNSPVESGGPVFAPTRGNPGPGTPGLAFNATPPPRGAHRGRLFGTGATDD